MPATLLILAALRYEAVALAKRLRLSFSSPTAATGTSASGAWLKLRVVGPRCGQLGRLEDLEDCRGVVMAGLAGALDPALGVGDVIVDGRPEWPLPPGRWRRGGIHTAAQLAATPAEKAALFAATGAMVVDMENAFARDFALRRGVPFLGIRAVSDRADESLDPATLHWIDASGRLRAGRLATHLCRRPGSLPALLRLGRRSRRAVHNLAAAVEEVVTGPPSRMTHARADGSEVTGVTA